MQMQKCLTHPAMLESVPRKFLVLCATSHHGRSRELILSAPWPFCARWAAACPPRCEPVSRWLADGPPWADLILPGSVIPLHFGPGVSFISAAASQPRMGMGLHREVRCRHLS